MKNLKILTTIVAIFMMFITSCETEDPTPSCEKNDFGTVRVENNTSTDIVVDVTEGSSEMNDERWLSVGGSTTYNKIDAGRITIWASRSGEQYSWYKDTHNLSSCEEFTYTWYDATGDNGNDEVAMTLEFSMYGKVIEEPVLINSTTPKNQ